MQMLARMRECASHGEMREALIIGQNLFSHAPGDPEVFGSYFSLLWSIVSTTEGTTEKQRYFQQMSTALAAFSEAVDLNDAMVEYIKGKEDALSTLYQDIQDYQTQRQRETVKAKILHNDQCLKQANEIASKLEAATDQVSFDAALTQLQQCDSSFEKEYLSDRQKAQYESLTRKCSQIVDLKVRRFERDRNVAYNLQAIEAFEKVYRFFKDGNVTEDHKAIVTGLFGFDATRLFNETLTYYNHVYSYVLSKLNDEEKFILTKAAIRSELRR